MSNLVTNKNLSLPQKQAEKTKKRINWRYWLPRIVGVITLGYIVLNIIIIFVASYFDKSLVVSAVLGRLSDISLQLWTGTLLIYLTYELFEPEFRKISNKVEARVSQKLELADLCNRFADAQENTTLYIMNYWSTLIAHDPYWTNFLKVLRAPNSKIKEVRLLMVNPFHTTTIQERQEALGEYLDNQYKLGFYPSPTVQGIIMHCLDELLRQDNIEKVHVRLLNESPPISLYTWGTRGSIGFFPPGELSSSYQQIEFPMSGEISELALRVFDERWDEYCFAKGGIPQDLQWYENERKNQFPEEYF